MVRLHTYEQNALALAKDHYAVYRTPSVEGDAKFASLAQVCIAAAFLVTFKRCVGVCVPCSFTQWTGAA